MKSAPYRAGRAARPGEKEEERVGGVKRRRRWRRRLWWCCRNSNSEEVSASIPSPTTLCWGGRSEGWADWLTELADWLEICFFLPPMMDEPNILRRRGLQVNRKPTAPFNIAVIKGWNDNNNGVTYSHCRRRCALLLVDFTLMLCVSFLITYLIITCLRLRSVFFCHCCAACPKWVHE